MRELLNTSILVFAFCFCAFGQTNNTAPCPVISVTGPAGISQLNEPITFTASIGEKAKDYKIQYNWTVNGGEIFDGQGTETVRVVASNSGENLTVAIEITGLPINCANIAIETSPLYCGSLQPIQIDVFSEPLAQIDKNRINEIVRALQNDPTAELYITFKHKEKTSSKMTNQKQREISNSLAKAGLAADRITNVTDYGQTDSVEFLLVPAGATPPKIEGN